MIFASDDATGSASAVALHLRWRVDLGSSRPRRSLYGLSQDSMTLGGTRCEADGPFAEFDRFAPIDGDPVQTEDVTEERDPMDLARRIAFILHQADKACSTG